jgi:Uma2 family endonuclease
MSTVAQGITAEQLLRMPRDGYRYDLIRGELRKMSPAGGYHGWTTMKLAVPLGAHVIGHDLGAIFAAETGFQLELDPDTVLAPDIAFLRKERIPPEEERKGFWVVAPDLVVEVVSPGDSAMEVDEKVQLWLELGSKVVWLVNPKRRTVTVWHADRTSRLLTENETLDGADMVPDFQIAIANIFR